MVDAVERLRGAFPFPLRDVDTDNGSGFLNEVSIGSCKEHGVELTRSGAHRCPAKATTAASAGHLTHPALPCTNESPGRRKGHPGLG